jgi:hypothetical protein
MLSLQCASSAAHRTGGRAIRHDLGMTAACMLLIIVGGLHLFLQGSLAGLKLASVQDLSGRAVMILSDHLIERVLPPLACLLGIGHLPLERLCLGLRDALRSRVPVCSLSGCYFLLLDSAGERGRLRVCMCCEAAAWTASSFVHKEIWTPATPAFGRVGAVGPCLQRNCFIYSGWRQVHMCVLGGASAKQAQQMRNIGGTLPPTRGHLWIVRLLIS